MKKVENFDEYIASFPEETQELLNEMRSAIGKAAPKAEEIISYGMPAYKLYGNLVYFAGYKNHIGFYPGAAGIANFKKEISGYKNAKGSVQFRIDEPLPLKLVTKIVKFRVTENIAKEKMKAEKKAAAKKAKAVSKKQTNK